MGVVKNYDADPKYHRVRTDFVRRKYDTLEKLATAHGVTRHTLYRWIRQGNWVQELTEHFARLTSLASGINEEHLLIARRYTGALVRQFIEPAAAGTLRLSAKDAVMISTALVNMQRMTRVAAGLGDGGQPVKVTVDLARMIEDRAREMDAARLTVEVGYNPQAHQPVDLPVLPPPGNGTHPLTSGLDPLALAMELMAEDHAAAPQNGNGGALPAQGASPVPGNGAQDHGRPPAQQGPVVGPRGEGAP